MPKRDYLSFLRIKCIEMKGGFYTVFLCWIEVATCATCAITFQEPAMAGLFRISHPSDIFGLWQTSHGPLDLVHLAIG